MIFFDSHDFTGYTKLANRPAGALLLADLILYPDWNMGKHAHTAGDKKKSRAHEIKEPNDRINAFKSHGLIWDKYPNFYAAGFIAQAFIDITLAPMRTNQNATWSEKSVREALSKIDNVILIFTIFGTVDLRCKVVGLTLRQVEETAMKIRDIPGVEVSATSIIIDETEYGNVRERWASLIINHAEKLEPHLPTKKKESHKPPIIDPTKPFQSGQS